MQKSSFNQDNWTGRIDSEDGELGLRIHQVISDYDKFETSSVQPKVLLGFCSEEGVERNKGRIGAKNSPDLIRKSLANLPLHFFETDFIFDAGNISCDDKNLESAREEQINQVDKIIQQNHFPIIIGGGHETALGDFLALAKSYKNIGIINLDAHFDLRTPNPKSTSGTPFYEMAKYCEEHEINFNYIPIGIQELGNTKALFNRAENLGVYGECEHCKGEGEVWENTGYQYLRDNWVQIEPPTGDGYQLWETTSEGSPESPVFETLEALCEWCEDNATTFSDYKATKKK